MSGKTGQIYKAEVKITAPSTDDLTLEGPKIPEGKAVRIRALYVIDLTTANKTLRLGYDRAGEKYWLKRAAAGTGAYGVWHNGQLMLVEGEKPVGMVESPTKGDTCILVARGVYT